MGRLSRFIVIETRSRSAAKQHTALIADEAEAPPLTATLIAAQQLLVAAIDSRATG